MTINYLTGEAPGEDTLDKEMDIRYLDNKRENGSYDATTASIAEALKNRGFVCSLLLTQQMQMAILFMMRRNLRNF